MSRRWIQKYISETQAKEISVAVQNAEAGTAGDIVPMIVRRSSAVRHVPVILALSFALLFLGLEMAGLNGWYLGDVFPFIYEHWLMQIGCLLILFALAWWLSHLHPVQRLLTSDIDEIDQVEKRAQLEFFLQRVNRTHRHSAILIFVSVMERRAVILADEGLAKNLSPKVWNEVLAPLSRHLRRGEWTAGFQDAIRQCGELLKTHFPASPGQTADEISNQLIIKE
jgi:putative membrane protein